MSYSRSEQRFCGKSLHGSHLVELGVGIGKCGHSKISRKSIETLGFVPPVLSRKRPAGSMLISVRGVDLNVVQNIELQEQSRSLIAREHFRGAIVPDQEHIISLALLLGPHPG